MNRTFRVVMGAAALLLAGAAAAKPWWMRGVESNENDFLPPDVAFRVGARLDGNQVRVRWVIADGYYLYRQRMDIQAESPDLELGSPAFPPGQMKTDPYLGTQEIFLQQVEATAAFTRTDGGAHPLEIKVTYQGCAVAGLCYPPITRVLFPTTAATPAAVASHPWEGVAIIGGGAAFLLAGLLLRRDKRLASPAT
jgi:thiol:disulfide interchange protein DsbD